MEPASIRTKNPGAMWGSPLAIKWGAHKTAVVLNDGLGQGNNIAVFDTYVDGICAQIALWRTDRYKNKRFADAIAVWSGGNSVESYIKFVCQRVTGMTRDTVMNDEFWRGPMAIPFLKAQAWHEAGKQYPAPDADWIEARNRLLAGLPPPPPKDTDNIKGGVPRGGIAKTATSAGTVAGTAVVIDKVARKPAAQGGGIDWMLAIPILAVGLSIAAVAWFVWPKKVQP